MRHQNGFGSIVCLDKTGKKRRKPWAVRITVGWQDGRQQRKYLGYFKTQREALIALADYHKNGYNLDVANLTLSEVYDRWINRIESKASKNVLASHHMARARFDRMGNVPIVNLKADQLQDWMDGIDLKPGTKRRLKSTMIQLFDYAIRNDIVHSNYAKHIEINEKIEKTGKIFTEDEIKTLWADVENPTAQWILILIYSGMRIGELLAMTSDTMHLDEQYMIGGSKSEAGIDRVIPLHDAILPIVTHRIGRARHLMRDEKGRKLLYGKALKQFKEYMIEHDWDHRPHDTRKTAVSLMHGAGIPMEVIRKIVGHSGKGVTEQVYLYKTPKELVEAINMISV